MCPQLSVWCETRTTFKILSPKKRSWSQKHRAIPKWPFICLKGGWLAPLVWHLHISHSLLLFSHLSFAMESQHSILFWISSLPFAGLDGRLPFFADSRINNRKLSVFCCCTLLAPSPLSQYPQDNIYCQFFYENSLCQFSWVIFMKILIVIALAILIRWSWVGADNLLRRRSANSFTKFFLFNSDF